MRKNIKIYEEIQNSKVAKVNLVVLCGAQQEKKNENGIAHFLEHMNLYFAEDREFAINIQGTTDFECTQYEIQCHNDYAQVMETIEKMYAIINGGLLSPDNMSDVKNAIIKEIKFQKRASFYKSRNCIIQHLLPQYWKDKMPVGNEAVIRSLSFDQIVDYQNRNYNDIAICVSSSFKIYNILGADDIISKSKERHKYYSKEKSWFYWTLNVYKGKNSEVIYNIYFENRRNLQNTTEYLKYEFIKTYFFILFDKILKKELINVGLPTSEAILYENEILGDLCIVDYEFRTIKKDISLVKQIVLKTMRQLEQQEQRVGAISVKAVQELNQKIRKLSFEEKCKLDFMYGIDLRSGVEVENLQKEIEYEKICEIARKYGTFHADC